MNEPRAESPRARPRRAARVPVPTGRSKRVVWRQPETNERSAAARPAFSRDGTILAGGSGDGTARLFPVAAPPSRVVGEAATGLISLDLSPDQQSALVAGLDGTVRLWDLASGALTSFEGHLGRAGAARFSPDGKQIISTSEDGTVRCWSDDLPEEPGALRAWIAGATGEK